MTDSRRNRDALQPGTVEHAAHQHFIGWQCRVRQHAMRYAIGRPSSGMVPQVYVEAAVDASGNINGQSLGQLIIVLNKSDSTNYAKQFRHMVLKTQDPNERYDSALTYFSGTYYQQAHEFDSQLAALFGPDSALATTLLNAGQCALEFNEYRQRFVLPCSITELAEHELSYQSTYWHNRLFNPKMPAGVRILGFAPDWSAMVADPPLGEQYRT